MEKNNILKANLLDILFDGRNKQYGAYDLRKTYNNRLGKALIMTGSIAVLIFSGTLFAGSYSRSHGDVMTTDDVYMAKASDPLPPLPPPPVLHVQPPPTVNQIRFTPPVVVKNELVDPDDKIDEITAETTISTQTIISDYKDPKVQVPVEIINSTAIQNIPIKDKEPDIFISVEKEAEFPGGYEAWRRFLEKNLNPNIPVDNNAPEGTYKVIVQFIVSLDGSISDVQALTKYGYGMEEEAVKAIKKGPNWKPALQNGRNVNAYRKQPVTFIVPEQ
jgi:periplasmic protein TonB